MVLVMKARVQYTSKAAKERQRESTEDMCVQFVCVCAHMHVCARVGEREEMSVSERRCVWVCVNKQVLQL